MAKFRTFKCLNCNEDFQSNKACKSRIPKFCSKKCYGKSIYQKKDCLLCGAEIDGNNGRKSTRIYCSVDCRVKSRIGTQFSEEWKLALSEGRKKSPKCKGENLYNWKGGNARRNALVTTREYRDWRQKVFIRDNFTCQSCSKRGGYLEAHHIKSKSEFPELIHDIDNGQTLCKECHKKTDNYGRKAIGKTKLSTVTN